MDFGEHRRFADRAYMSYRVRTQQVLRQNVAPTCLADAEKLRLLCTEAIRQLRTVKADCIDGREALRQQLISSDTQYGRISAKLAECAELLDHVERLVDSIHRAKVEAGAAAVEFRQSELVFGETIPMTRPEGRLVNILDGLSGLHAAGSLTDEEFERVKSRVIPAESSLKMEKYK